MCQASLNALAALFAISIVAFVILIAVIISIQNKAYLSELSLCGKIFEEKYNLQIIWSCNLCLSKRIITNSIVDSFSYLKLPLGKAFHVCLMQILICFKSSQSSDYQIFSRTISQTQSTNMTSCKRFLRKPRSLEGDLSSGQNSECNKYTFKNVSLLEGSQ